MLCMGALKIYLVYSEIKQNQSVGIGIGTYKIAQYRLGDDELNYLDRAGEVQCTLEGLRGSMKEYRRTILCTL